MLYREIIAVCSQIHTKHTNKTFIQNARLLSVKPGGKRNCIFFPPHLISGNRETKVPAALALPAAGATGLQDTHLPSNG